MSQSSLTSDEVPPSSVAKSYSLFHSSSQTTTIKLDRSNFLVWESVVLPLIEGNKLQAHINGSGVVPPEKLTVTISVSSSLKSNPAYEEWYAVD
ncbi:hypothetical protein QN277_014521 [Acacia crassicarpa]|uniref:Retrotransposon Copia-like N-terminal domain-containing protein n=1 Tax=Acacia crassicarpa TaxID=499986 RepID=A0AAE1M7Q6_9FABA|nr:hypothetical protein QN277_014521 [Acacia crassicarpa]